MRNATWPQTFLLFICLSAAALGGCTVTYNDPKPVTLEPVDKVNIAVELRLTDALQQAKWESSNLEGDHFIQPLGKALCTDSESLARMIFREVQVTNGGNESAPPSQANVDAVLIPALASVERDSPAVVLMDQITTLQVTWTLLDKNGKVLWVTTVTGEGKGPMGQPWLKESGAENIHNALQDLFRKSAAEIASAPLIRQYAARVAKPNTR